MEDFLSTTQAAKMLGVTGRRLAQMAERGEIEATRTEGGRWQIPKSAVDDEIQRRMEAGPFWEAAVIAGDPDYERQLGRLEGHIEALTEERDRLRADLRMAQFHMQTTERRLDRLDEALDNTLRPAFARLNNRVDRLEKAIESDQS